MRIGLLTEHDLKVWRNGYDADLRSASSPYLVDELERLGHDLVQLRPVRIPDRWAHKVEHRLGYGVRSALDVRTARDCDVVLALLETQAWAYSRLRGPLRLPPLVTLECWLADDVRRADAAGRARLRRRAGRLGNIISLSRNQTGVLRALGLPAARTHAIPFAVAVDFFTPGEERPSGRELPGGHDILFVGQDRGRDISTFLAAMRRLDGRHSALMVTKPELLQGHDVPPNVHLHGTVDHYAYRELLRSAPVVVVPTFELAYPTGQSVALEAAAVGAPLVVTDTPAMREYVSPTEAEMPAVGDAGALAAALVRFLDDPAAARERSSLLRERVRRDNCASAMWSAAEPVIDAAAGCSSGRTSERRRPA